MLWTEEGEGVHPSRTHSPGKVTDFRCRFSWIAMTTMTMHKTSRKMMSKAAAPPTAPPTTAKSRLLPTAKMQTVNVRIVAIERQTYQEEVGVT